MATKLVPIEWRLFAARQFIESLTEEANTNWYAWFGDHVSTASPGDVYDMTLDTSVNLYRNMIMGKRVTAGDVALMIRKVMWESGTVYAMYDHGDPIMHTKDFFVTQDAGSYLHVFKCLDNNQESPSTVSPNFADVDSTDAVYQTSDGYRWKYMFSVDRTTADKFSTSRYFPLVANSSVESSAVAGAIDVIRVYEMGEGYDNYLTGTFDGSHVRVGGNNLVYSVSSNTSASPMPGYYTGCMLYVSSGTGAGGYSEVVDYFANNSGKFVQVSKAFTVEPTNGSEWELYPSVRILSGGDQTTNAAARALINAVGNAVYRVEMLERGEDYTYATASVVANAAVGVVVAANVVPVYSPPGGHGSDAAAELGATRVGVSVKLSNNESGTVPEYNSFAQVGLLRDPTWANVELTLDTGAGNFYTDETVFRYSGVQLVDDATAITDDFYLSSNSGAWPSRVAIGDKLVVEGGSTQHQLLQVNAIPNTTHVQVNSSIQFSCSEATVLLVDLDNTDATVLDQPSPTSMHVELTGGGGWGVGNKLIGQTSGAAATVATIARNGVTKGFGTFVQCWKYDGTTTSGTFTPDEYVYQGATFDTATASARLHMANASVMLCTQQLGQIAGFDANVAVKGANSGALFSISAKYSPEIKYGTGRVTYVQNIDPVERAVGQAESFKLILEF